MKSIAEIKIEKEVKVSQLITSCLMFFAFNDKQWEENKTPLQEGEKYVSIGAGAYLPKGKVQSYSDGIDELNKWYKSEVKANKQRKANIAYELANHEAYYTGSIEDTVDALGSDYTEAEVREVYKQGYKEWVSANC